ncbi:MAG: AI-2E family transporter [Helcococcus sp.]|nr:AI-2E family transporter [Helcococcus sp.]
MDRLNDKKFLKRLIMLTIAVLTVIYIGTVLNFFRNVWDVIFPFVLALAIAYILNIVMRFIEEKVLGLIKTKWMDKIKRPISILLSIVFVIAIIALILSIVIPQMVNSIRIIVESIPKLIEDIYKWLLEHPRNELINTFITERLNEIQQNWQYYANNIWEFIRNNIGGLLGSTFDFINSIFGTFFTIFVTLIFAIYILSGKERLGEEFNSVISTYLPKKHFIRIKYFLSVMNEKFESFIKGQVADAIIIGFLVYLTLLIAGMPYAITIGIIVMVTAFIPMLGAYIGGAIGFLMIAAENIQQGFIFILLLVIVQQLEGDIIYPRLIGNSIGLPGIWTFLAVIVGGAIAGPVGMLLFVPLSAGFYKIINDDIRNRKEKKKENKFEIEEGKYIS